VAQYAPQVQVQPQPHGVAAPVDAQPAQMSKRSRAPQGMGSSLRLDDPSLQDTMIRARNERAGLAEEYRRVVAPLVDTTQAEAVPVHAHGHVHAPPAPGRLFAHGAGQETMPRPQVAASAPEFDPAIFQRRTPMAHQAPPVEQSAPHTMHGAPPMVPATA
jgi:hypothetical protein